MTAIEKLTLLPGRLLEDIAPSLKKKGRIQVSADEDITVFDAGTIAGKAIFEKGRAFSEVVEYVMVGGVLVLKNGETAPILFLVSLFMANSMNNI